MMTPFFVSSTFKDMQYERDILHTTVFPELNEIGREYGHSVSSCDLRWGINTLEMSEKEGTQKILKVCLDEIDRCHPYMIVILGDRYGWIPNDNSIDEAISERPSYVLQDKDISVTELEIDYGVLSNPQNAEHVLFYFRENIGNDKLPRGESPLHKQKLENLKQRIINTPGVHYRVYQVHSEDTIEEDLKSFSSMVLEDLQELLLPKWKHDEDLDVYEKDQLQHSAFLNESSQSFQGRIHTLNSCKAIIRDNKTLMITGPSGSGKSTLISRLGTDLSKDKDGYNVIPIYCGFTEKATNGFDILRYIIWILENRLDEHSHYEETVDLAHNKLENYYSHIAHLFDRYENTKSKPIVFIIDGINQLIQDEVIESLTFIPSKKYTNIHFVISMIYQQTLPCDYECVELVDLEIPERKIVAKSLLKINHRELSDTVIESLCNLRSAGLPLYIRLIIDRLLMMNREDFQYISEYGGTIETINNYQLSLINNCPDSISEMSFFLLNHAAKVLGGSSVNTILYLIAISRKGLRITDIEGILSKLNVSWNQIDFLSYIKYMRSAFVFRNDGRIDFSHDSIKEGYLSNCEDVYHYNQSIAEHLLSLQLYDPIRSEEVVWHLIQTDMYQDFYTTITKYCWEHKSEEQIKKMAKDVINYMSQSSDTWLVNVLRSYPNDQSLGSFGHFINFYVYYGLVESYTNLKIRIKIAEILLEVHTHRFNQWQHYGDLWDITIECERLAEAYRAFDTEETDDTAISYSKLCIKYRELILKQFKAINTHDERLALLADTSNYAGIELNNTQLTEEIVIQLTEALQLEVLRGIGVAHKDIALAISPNTDSKTSEAMSHIKMAIDTTQSVIQMTDERFVHSYLEDLHHEYIIAANIARNNLQNPVYSKEAIHYLNKAIDISEKMLLETNESEWEATYYSDLVSKIILFESYGGEYLGKAITLSKKVESTIEMLWHKKRLNSCRHILLRLYNALDSIYSSEGEYQDINLALYYRKKYSQLQEDETRREESITNKQRHINLYIKNIDNAQIETQLDVTNLQDILSNAYSEAQSLFDEYPSEDNCYRLNRVLLAANDLIKRTPHLTPESVEIADIEINIAIFMNKIMASNASEDDIRHCIFILNECSERMQALKIEQSELISTSAILFFVLDCVGIDVSTLIENLGKRAFEISGLTVRVAEYLIEAFSDSEINKDGLAVSLVKYGPLCMMYNPKECVRVNKRLNKLAKELYHETGRDKYQMMILSSQMGLMLSNYEENPSEHEGELGKFLKDVFGI